MKIYKDLKYMKERLIVAGLLCLSVKGILIISVIINDTLK